MKDIKHANLSSITTEIARSYLTNPNNKNVVMGTPEHKRRAEIKLDANKAVWWFPKPNPINRSMTVLLKPNTTIQTRPR